MSRLNVYWRFLCQTCDHEIDCNRNYCDSCKRQEAGEWIPEKVKQLTLSDANNQSRIYFKGFTSDEDMA
jgi:hypothetical protein